MATRLLVAVLTAVLMLYIVFVGVRAVELILTGDLVAVVMGVVIFIVPIVAVWALFREIQFGVISAKLGKYLDDAGQLPHEQLETNASGRIIVAAADEVFPMYRDATQAEPENWRNWYKLGLVYDAAGDRKRARQSVRRAIELSQYGRKLDATND